MEGELVLCQRTLSPPPLCHPLYVWLGPRRILPLCALRGRAGHGALIKVRECFLLYKDSLAFINILKSLC